MNVDRQHFGWGFQLLFGISTLCTGYGLAGLMRRFLVWPAAMIWPGNLVNATFFHVLHDDKLGDPVKKNTWRIGRYQWFLYVTAGGFVSDSPVTTSSAIVPLLQPGYLMSHLGLVFFSRLEYVFRLAFLKEEKTPHVLLLAMDYLLQPPPNVAERQVTNELM